MILIGLVPRIKEWLKPVPVKRPVKVPVPVENRKRPLHRPR